MPADEFGKADSFGFGKIDSAKHLKNKSVKEKETESGAEKGNMDEAEKESYLKAGKIAQQVIKFAKGFIKKDMLLIDVAEKIEGKIIELGGAIAFPVNTSIDEVTAHYTPSKNDLLKATGLLKIDLGVEVNGFIADCAFSFDFSEDGRYKDMIKMNETILESVLAELKVGSPVKIIGNKISDMLKGSGYQVIKNLAGHSLAKDDIHPGLTVSNYRNENNFELSKIAIAIEPFLTIDDAAGEIYEGKTSEIYVLQQDKMPRDREARKLLEFVKENYRTKPFCKRWLEKAGLTKFNFALVTLIREGILYNFPVLIEKQKKPVSQFEHSVIFADKVYVTTRG